MFLVGMGDIDGLIDKVNELMYVFVGMGDIDGLIDKVNELMYVSCRDGRQRNSRTK